ncbi:potassium channel family protein [Nocardia amamiensis]|uniref:potassium channel family protein n=1 Tax=Nocardia amamiensis TaxID=404578 RepID=UPI000A027FB3|nr:potassium channel family protein [Nocardia amamiensis]
MSPVTSESNPIAQGNDVETSAGPPMITRRQAWERATNAPMIVLALCFVGVYAWHVLDTGASPELDVWLTRADVGIWMVFAADFAIRLWLSTNRWRFVRTHPLELLIVLLPPFRPVRLLRAALLLVDTVNRRSATRARMAVFVGTSSVLVILLCSLAFFDAEYGVQDSKIDSFGDALWWSMVSVTTVGYGDVYPVTAEGRFVSLILMTFGIGLISFAIGTTTSWVMDQLRSIETSTERTDIEISLLAEEVRALRAEIAALASSAAGTPTAPMAPPDTHRP